MSSTAGSFLDIMRGRAEIHPDRPALIFLPNGEEATASWTYAELDQRAQCAASWIRARVAIGDRVVISHPSPEHWLTAFFGCMYAGVVAVPLAPLGPERNIAAIAADCGASLALLDRDLDRKFARVAPLSTLPRQVVEEISLNRDRGWKPPVLASDSVLLIQYTSGSTGTPKGVVIDHGNVLANQRMIQAAFVHDEASTFIGWLPLFHDMGLMGTVIQPLFVGATAALMPPEAFLHRPARWLRAIMTYRAHTSGGPNFAYELCCQRIRAEEVADLDLSSWRVAFNGSETVRAETLEHFAERFAPYGFRAESFLPCYGLAEATLFVAGHQAGRVPRIVEADRGALEQGRVEVSPDPQRHRLVSCGRPAPGLTVSILRNGSDVCGEGEVGEICITGDCVARGYWHADPWGVALDGPLPRRSFRTSDLGTFIDGELFVLGRSDDLIIIRGRNYHPQDLEHSASTSHSVLRSGHAAAFTMQAASPAADGDVRLILVQETNEALTPERLRQAVAAIRAAVASDHGVMLHEVVLVPKRTIPRTTSGKTCRRACRTLFATGGLPGYRPAARELSQGWLVNTIAQLLGVSPDEVDVGASPVALGLDSLAAVRLCHRAYDELGINLQFGELLATTSVDVLAASLASRGEAPAASVEPLPANGETFAMSARQRAMWFFQQYAPNSSAYQVVVAGRLLAPVEPSRLAAAVERVVERHPVLRSVFEWGDGEPRGRLLPASGQHFEVKPIAAISIDEIDSILEAECRRPFKLDQGPSFRVVLLRLWSRSDIILICAHHILVDLWSMAILFQELDAALADPPALLAAPKPEFELAFATREAEQIAAFEAAGGPARLLTRLDGVRSLQFPPQGWEAAEASTVFEISTAWIEISPETTHALRELSGRQFTTLYTVLLSGYAAVLHRYCGVNDFVIGSPTWARSPELRQAVGCFVNTIVVRCDVTGDPAFSELVGRLNGAVLDGLAQADYPYSLVSRRFRSATRQDSLVEALFTLQGVPLLEGADLGSFALGRAGGLLELEHLRLESLPVVRREFDLPFDLAIAELNGKLVGYLATRNNRVPAELGAQMMQHLVGILEKVARDPGWRVSSGPLVSEHWNASWVEEGGARSLIDLFAEQVGRTPQQPAIHGRDSELTYAELDRQAGRLGAALRGIEGPGAVGLLLPAGPAWTVAMVASMQARRAFVPLEATNPIERLAVLAEDAALRVLVTSADTAEIAFEMANRNPRLQTLVVADPEAREPAGWFVVERSVLTAAQPCNGSRPLAPGLDEVVYIVYTSGTTGAPKGVPITHGNLEHLMRWLVREFRIGTDTRMLQSLPVGFDFGLEEILSTLLGGGTLYSFAADDRRSPDDYLDLLERHRITMAFWTPSLAASLMSRGRSMPSLRAILLGGEMLERPLVARLRGLVAPVCRIWNGYGPTEAAINSSMYEVRGWDEAAHVSRSIPIGGPSGRTRLYVWNQHGALVPVGVPGELYIGGPGVAGGYLNRPGLTAECFLPDPNGPAGSRIYRTGDRVRWLPGGSLEFLGRADRQVKVRGYRVEPDESEHFLRRAPGILDAAVIASTTRENVELVAFVVAAPQDAAAAREFLRRQLPHYLVPTRWIELAALPSTANGKLDRAALANLVHERTTPLSIEPPLDHVEAEIQTSWQAALGIPVPRHASFFDLGGHSLSAIAVHRELERKLAVSFPASALFDFPTIVLLAGYLKGETHKRRSYSTEGLERAAHLKASLRGLRQRVRGSQR